MHDFQTSSMSASFIRSDRYRHQIFLEDSGFAKKAIKLDEIDESGLAMGERCILIDWETMESKDPKLKEMDGNGTISFSQPERNLWTKLRRVVRHARFVD
ncbi:unnamed protein product [Linum trigynum]|uniref:Uncharacterized protein n=1 Tax=Linum trigynum TaxID=586398 RepID=A0AAV2GTD5_9ROSI